jgi:hypothetical protein
VKTPTINQLPAYVYLSLERTALFPSFSMFYMLAIACLCIYTTAWLLNESVRLKEENEEII